MPEFNEFWEKSVLDFGEGKPWVRHADFRKDPELNPLGTPSGFIEITSRKIGRYGYEHCQEVARVELGKKFYDGNGKFRGQDASIVALSLQSDANGCSK